MNKTLDIKSLVVRSGQGRDLLRIPQLRLADGDLVGIRGPSGAGKTTFIHAISGLLDDVQGKISWGNVSLTDIGPHACAAFRAQNIGLVFQDFMLFDELSPKQNAGLASLFASRKERAAIVERGNSLMATLGLNSDDRRVATLSGGERQRVAVARALACDPPIVLADEPTASLDRSSADALIADLVRICRERGITLIAVSHDERLLQALDRIITIEDGELISDMRASQ